MDYREDRVAYDSQGHAWIRIGDQKHELTKEERRELESDKGQVDFEQELIKDHPYPQSFDAGRISQFATSFRESRGLSYEKSDEQILELRHFGKGDGKRFVPNVACVLLFANDPSGKFRDVESGFGASRVKESRQEQTTTQ